MFSTKAKLCSPYIHVLHTHDDIVVMIQESAVKINNVVGVAPMHNLQLPNDSLAHFLLCFDMDDLSQELAHTVIICIE